VGGAAPRSRARGTTSRAPGRGARFARTPRGMTRPSLFSRFNLSRRRPLPRSPLSLRALGRNRRRVPRLCDERGRARVPVRRRSARRRDETARFSKRRRAWKTISALAEIGSVCVVSKYPVHIFLLRARFVFKARVPRRQKPRPSDGRQHARRLVVVYPWRESVSGPRSTAHGARVRLARRLDARDLRRLVTG